MNHNRPIIDLLTGNDENEYENNDGNNFLYENIKSDYEYDEEIIRLKQEIERKKAEKAQQSKIQTTKMYPTEINGIDQNNSETFKRLLEGIEDIKLMVADQQINELKYEDPVEKILRMERESQRLKEEAQRFEVEARLLRIQNNLSINTEIIRDTNTTSSNINNNSRNNNFDSYNNVSINQRQSMLPEYLLQSDDITERGQSKKKNSPSGINKLPIETGTVPKQQIFIDHPSLNKINLLPNKKECLCSICNCLLKMRHGVVIKNCLHKFCIKCLVKYIDTSTNERIICPIFTNNKPCRTLLKVQVGFIDVANKVKIFQNKQNNNNNTNYNDDVNYDDDNYDDKKYNSNSNMSREYQNIQEMQSNPRKSNRTNDNHYNNNNDEFALENMPNYFRCAKLNCKGFGLIENEQIENITIVACPICESYNCLLCKKIHPGMTCKEHKETKQNNNSAANYNDVDNKWLCNVCGENNNSTLMNCPICNNLKSKNNELFNFDQWQCIHCTFNNTSNNAICSECSKTNDNRLKDEPSTKKKEFKTFAVLEKFKNIFKSDNNIKASGHNYDEIKQNSGEKQENNSPLDHWMCKRCTLKNEMNQMNCVLCGISKFHELPDKKNICVKCDNILIEHLTVKLEECLHEVCLNCFNKLMRSSGSFVQCPFEKCPNFYQIVNENLKIIH